MGYPIQSIGWSQSKAVVLGLKIARPARSAGENLNSNGSLSYVLYAYSKDRRPARSAGENLYSNGSLSYVLYAYSKDRRPARSAGENLYSNCVFNKILVFIACAGDHLEFKL